MVAFYQDWNNLLTNTIAKVKQRNCLLGNWSDTSMSRGYYCGLLDPSNIHNELLNCIQELKSDESFNSLFDCVWKGEFWEQSNIEMKLKNKEKNHVSFNGNLKFKESFYQIIGNFHSSWISFILLKGDFVVAALGELCENELKGVIFNASGIKGYFHFVKLKQ
jgi:hypothetical protein